ncbi:MAG: hydrolase [Armatimonadetes bacterium]|nr:hydrolase [Armatimonadota bacterium]
MKTILCYGDSNTWGYNAADAGRFPPEVRWPGVMRAALGEGFAVIEEGLNGRTTVWDDPIEGYKNGKEYLIPCIETHRPLDLVITALGINDLKKRFSLSAWDIAAGAGVLVDIVRKSETGPNGAAPKVLLVAPPVVGKLTDFADMFEGAPEKSRQLAPQFARVAAERGVPLVDSASIVKTTDLDGIHLEPEEHRKLGEALAAAVRAALSY